MMYLLDTHTFLWFINDDLSLSALARGLIEDPENIIYLSIASVWKMAIKVSLGKLDLPSPFTNFINEQMRENNFTLLQITPEHARIVAIMPFHHRDPFDRLIIAQSQSESLPLIGIDAVFDSYSIKRVW